MTNCNYSLKRHPLNILKLEILNFNKNPLMMTSQDQKGVNL